MKTHIITAIVKKVKITKMKPNEESSNNNCQTVHELCTIIFFFHYLRVV